MTGEGERPRFTLDGALVPGLLLLIARDLVLHDPPRELAWKLFHELKDTPKPTWLLPLLPRPAPVLLDDPVALVLAAAATGLAAAYAAAALLGAGPRVKAALIAAGSLLLVVVPTLACIALGPATGRPYGHDGGVVQLPLALDRVLSGRSPYGADYSGTLLDEQSRSSVFWEPLGGNPIVRHHWYLPGMHLVMAAPYLVSKALFGFFDPRLVTLAGYLLAILLVARLVEGESARLAAVAVFAVNPFVYWQQAFGANDVLSAVPLLLAALFVSKGRRDGAAALLGLAAAVKQLTWPFVPFFLVHLSGATSFRELIGRQGRARLARPALIAGGVFLLIVTPVAALDLRAFVADIFRYQTGSPGSEQYPLGGTPGFGFANLLIYAGAVTSLSDYFPFQRLYLLFVPVGLVLLRYQLKNPGLGSVLAAGSAALVTSLYLSRIVNPNYVILAALLLPVAALLDRRVRADLALVPLLLLLLATEVSLQEPFRATWEDAQAAGVSTGLPGWLAPDPAGPRWRDPLGTGLSGTLAGLALVYLVTGVAGPGRRLRLGLVAVAAVIAVGLPCWVLQHVGAATGTRRAQDAWYVEVLRSREAPGPGPWADRPGYSPTPVLEAWSSSWRRDPPRPLPGSAPSPLAFDAGRLLRALGGVEPRQASLLALLLAGILALRLTAGEGGLLLAALLWLSPASALGTTFGAGQAVSVALLLAAWRLGPKAGGVALGAAGGGAPAALLLGPLLPGRGDGRLLRAAPWMALGLVSVCLPLLMPFPTELLRWAAGDGGLSRGLGLSNLLFYRPGDLAVGLRLLRVAAPLLLLSFAAALARSARARAEPLAAAGALWAAALLVLPGSPADGAAVPVVLLGAACLPAAAASRRTAGP